MHVEPIERACDDVATLRAVGEKQASERGLVLLLVSWRGKASLGGSLVVKDSRLRHMAHPQATQTRPPGEVDVVSVEKEGRVESAEGFEYR